VPEARPRQDGSPRALLMPVIDWVEFDRNRERDRIMRAMLDHHTLLVSAGAIARSRVIQPAAQDHGDSSFALSLLADAVWLHSQKQRSLNDPELERLRLAAEAARRAAPEPPSTKGKGRG
jgi:hypothetical protein